MSRRAFLVAISAIGLGILFDILLYGKLPGISFPLYIVVVLGVLVGLAKKLAIRLPETVWLLMLPLLFFASMVAVRANEFVTFLNIVTSLYLLLALAYVTFQPQLQKYRLIDYAAPALELPAKLFARWKETLSEATTARQIVRKHPLAPQVLRGVLIALPILFLFGVLFASADLVFRKFLTDTFDISLDMSVVFRLFLIALTASFFMGWLAYILQKRSEVIAKDTTPKANRRSLLPKIGAVELTILFGSLNVLFLGFIIVQLAYLFGGEQNILSTGFTYAEYARKGFFELIAVAMLAFGIIWTGQQRLVRDDAQHSLWFRLLAGLLIAQVMVIMISAFQRLSLYESAYGFTTLRLYSHIFIVWLAATLALLFYKIVWQRPERVFAFGVFLSVLLMLGVINVMNVDGFVARKNIDRYHATGKIDAYYLNRLSPDAVPELVKLLKIRDTTVRSLIAETLESERTDLREEGKKWQSANLARKQALDTLSRR